MLTGRAIHAAKMLDAVMPYARCRFQRVSTVVCFNLVGCTHENNVSSMHGGSIGRGNM